MIDGCHLVYLLTRGLLLKNFITIIIYFLLFLLFEHNHTPSGKKTVTGIMQVVTTSQVQIIGCKSKAIL